MRTLWYVLLIVGLLIVGVAGYEILFAPNMSIKKPAIYLYPEQTTTVSVRVRTDGTLTNTLPPYGSGWDVIATPESIIDGQYEYLFYEADLQTVDIPENGWVVSNAELSNWFDTNLPLLGLNLKEIAQFKEYWLSELPAASYYDIRLLDQQFLEQHLALDILPQPQTLIRVELAFKSINTPYKLQTPLIVTPERNGFTVVEWGGLVIH